MPDTLTAITNLIQSPPGQLAAGGVLAGIVWKFFERVETVLNETTKREMAVWLVDVDLARRWQLALSCFVRAICGHSAMSLRCAGLALATASVSFSIAYAPLARSYSSITGRSGLVADSGLFFLEVFAFFVCFVAAFVVLLLVDYDARRVRLGVWELVQIAGSSVVFMFGMIAFCLILGGSNSGDSSGHSGSSASALWRFVNRVRQVPVLALAIAALVSASWLWLYGAGAAVLRAMRRLDMGFQWFNRRFDVEKKPLQSIGLVAGALVAIVYWLAVIVSRITG